MNTFLYLAFAIIRTASSCKSYEELSTKTAQQLDPRRYQGIWYEVASHNVIGTGSCQCTFYNFTLTSNTTFKDTFTCHKGSPTAAPFVLHNHGSFPADMPGKMVESLGPVSPPYWVLNIWGDYEYSLVYACVPILGEYIYFFSRTRAIPEDVRAEMNSFATSQGISLAQIREVPMAGCEDAQQRTQGANQILL